MKTSKVTRKMVLASARMTDDREAMIQEVIAQARAERPHATKAEIIAYAPISYTADVAVILGDWN